MCNCQKKNRDATEKSALPFNLPKPVSPTSVPKEEAKAAFERAVGQPPAPVPVVRTSDLPARSGACPFCLRKHLLKAAGYAEEVREDATREWEKEKLLQNLMLAEDHAEELGEMDFKEAIRAVRLQVEDGTLPKIWPLLARARALVAAASRDGSPAIETGDKR